MIPDDRLLCAFVEPRHAGDMFPHWPLHITIVPWFRVEIPSDELSRMLSIRLSLIEPFQVHVDGEAHIGRRGRRTANLLRTPSPLQTIEQEARKLLHEKDAWLVDETTKTSREFRPHVTAQKSARLHEGDTFTCDSLYIVRQKGDYKEIVSRIDL